MSSWIQAAQIAACIVPVGALILLFVNAWMKNVEQRITKKMNKSECDLHTQNFKEELGRMNGEVKESYDKIIAKLDEHKEDYIDVQVALTKLTQRVDDLVRNGNGLGGQIKRS